MNQPTISFEEAEQRALQSMLAVEPGSLRDFKCKWCLDTGVVYRDGFGGGYECKRCEMARIRRERGW